MQIPFNRNPLIDRSFGTEHIPLAYFWEFQKQAKNLRLDRLLWSFLHYMVILYVVYFDQQTHACACVRIVENDQKHKKIMNQKSK